MSACSQIRTAPNGCYVSQDDKKHELWFVHNNGYIAYFKRIEGQEQHSAYYRELFRRNCPKEWRGQHITNQEAKEWLKTYNTPVRAVYDSLATE